MAILVFEEQTYTQARLDTLTGGLAATLATRGVRAGGRVALMSSTRPEFIIAVGAIWRLGAAAVLVSPSWRQGDVEHALAVSQPAHAVGDHPVLAELMPMLHLDELVPPPVPPPGRYRSQAGARSIAADDPGTGRPAGRSRSSTTRALSACTARPRPRYRPRSVAMMIFVTVARRDRPRRGARQVMRSADRHRADRAASAHWPYETDRTTARAVKCRRPHGERR